MPTIAIRKKDLESLLGQEVTPAQVEAYLPWVKGEFKGYDAGSDELRVELSDSNRPDLWCVEGIARQIRGRLRGDWPEYDFFYGGSSPGGDPGFGGDGGNKTVCRGLCRSRDGRR